MTIESPESYGEMYWASQLDAAETFEEHLEKSIAPYVPHIFTDPEIRAAMPFDVLSKLEGLLQFESPGLGAVGGRFVSEVADSAVSAVMTPAMRQVSYAANKALRNMMPSPDQAVTLFRRKRLLPEHFDNFMSFGGFSKQVGNLAYIASGPFPTVPELLRWARYHGEPDNVWSTLFPYVDLDAVDFPKFEWLARQQLTTEQINTLYKRQAIDQVQSDLMLRQVGWQLDQTQTVRDLAYLIPNAMIMLQGDLFAEASPEAIAIDLGTADIHPDYQQRYIDAVLAKPASIDLVSYHLRQENELRDLNTDLKKIGIHPDYFDVYQTLANRIPPIADIITMAVREAFTPAIAERFGQYEDFPRDFAKWAGQQGLSEDWAKRYWAAHWGLPSPQQGFEMLHRGIIERDDLELLMKAQDIMPFWRDKMVGIAFRPLTRVDVRRMYKEGILDEAGVYKAYLEHGYSDTNAEAMTEFTVAYVLTQQSKFTSADVVKAYTQRMIDKSEASSLLRMLGVKSDNVRYILDTADYKREWEIIDNKTGAIRNLYKKGELNENTARSELLRLDLPSDHVNTLMETWWYEKKAEGVSTWTKAETLKFMSRGIITEERAERELGIMGYDPEHIAAYLKNLEWTQ